MKLTKFNSIHRQLGAKLVEFAGFQMPIYYSSIIDEHLAVRSSVGVFDVSHMGEIIVRGKNALELVQKITTNDAAKLNYGRVQYSAMCYEHGGIVDDLLVYKLENSFMLVVNASNKQKDFDWIVSQKLNDAEVIDASDDYSLLAVQGPRSLETLSELVDFNLSELEYYHFRRSKIGNIDVILSRTGYTGELGYEVYFLGDEKVAETIWNLIFDAGRQFQIKPIGLGARDSLRLEAAYCLYGNDIDETTNPLEAGLGWITKLSKDDFIGKQAILNVKEKGLSRKLCGFELIEKGIPRHGCDIFLNNQKIGYVTSGMISPSLNKPLGLGYFDISFINEQTIFEVDIRGKRCKAKFTKTPFIKK
ncbi:MAG: glycine cleavage system aminomethyltransferase GcvT [Ignavibacteria bacterium]|nr:glycine cleavage system aminomethyltransferase GcvT [Ignavibacteria bacterium]